LPLGLSKIYKREIVDKTVVRSDDELIAIAAGRHLADRVIRLSDSELLKMSTSGEFTEDGYIMRSVVSVLRDVGGKRSFE
jgi:ATP-dependent protease HslVU (ClpYQ) ATPase subunit